MQVSRLAGRATGRTVMYLQSMRQQLHTLVTDVHSPEISASQSELQRSLNEVRSIHMELVRMRSFSPRALQQDALQMALGTPGPATSGVSAAGAGSAAASRAGNSAGRDSSNAVTGSGSAYPASASTVLHRSDPRLDAPPASGVRGVGVVDIMSSCILHNDLFEAAVKSEEARR
jgi:hypothetical protein